VFCAGIWAGSYHKNDYANTLCMQVKPISARNGCRKTGRRNDGWNSLAARRAKETRKASQGCDI